MSFLTSLVVFIVLLRLVPGVICARRQITIGDETTHFAFIEDIKKYRNDWTERYLIKLEHRYPVLFHKLVASSGLNTGLLFILPTLLELSIVVVILSLATTVSTPILALVVVSVLFYPGSIRQRQRSLSFSARSQGELFGVMPSLLLLFGATPFIVALIAAFLPVYLLRSSKFGFQVYCVNMIFLFLYAIISGSLSLLIVPLSSSILVLFPKDLRAFGEFSKFAKEQVEKTGFGRQKGRKLTDVAMNSTVLGLLIYVPIATIAMQSHELFLVVFVAVSLLVYVFTSTRHFRHWGEADRYFDSSVVVIVAFLAVKEVEVDPLLSQTTSLVFFGTSLLYVTYWSLVSLKQKRSDIDWSAIESIVADRGGALLCDPIRLNFECRLFTSLEVAAYPGVPTSAKEDRFSPSRLYPESWGTVDMAAVRGTQFTHILTANTSDVPSGWKTVWQSRSYTLLEQESEE